MDPSTQAPDLQAATGQTPPVPMTGPSVLAALGALQGPAPGLAAGSGMLSALAGRPGANPYLQQHAVNQQGSLDQINSLRVAQQHDQSAMLQQQVLQERMREHALRREDAARTVTKDILFGPHAIEDESVRTPFVQQYAKSLGGLGINVPDSMKAVWAKGGPSQESQKNLATQLASADVETDAASKGMIEARAQKFYLDHGGKPEDWGVVSQNLRSPAYLKSVNLPTPDELKIKSLDIQAKEAKAIEAKYPELAKGKPEVIQDMIMQHRKYNGGAPYTEGTPESQQMAYALAQYNEAKREEMKLAATEEMRSRLMIQQQAAADQRQQAGFAQQDARQQAQFAQQDALLTKRLEAQKTSAAQQKHDSALAVSESFLNQLKAIVPQMDAEKFLPQSEGFIADKQAGLNRGLYPNHQVLREWYELQANMIGWARGVQNDIGPRAMAAFHETNRIMSQPPTKAGMERIIKNMEAQLRASISQQVQPAPNAVGSPLAPVGGGKITPAQRDALLKKGYTKEQIESAYGR